MRTPELVAIERVPLERKEVFIAAGGFEERVLALPKALEYRDKGGVGALLLDYLPHVEANRTGDMALILEEKACSVRIALYNRLEPNQFSDEFRRLLVESGADGVYLDISGMSRLAIMIILDVIREMNLRLRIVYAEAQEYAPTEDEFEAAKAKGEQHLPTSFIHTGVYDVLHVDALSSIRMQSQAVMLIAFDSFNEALCQALVNSINPSRFILINGRPPRRELKWREDATAYVHQFLRREWSVEDDNDPIRTTSTLDYGETYKELVKLYWTFSSTHRIVVAPTGSKMQTVGSYLLRAVHEDVHVEYPTVEGFFAEKYSKGVRGLWQADFGNFGEFVAKLREKEVSEHLGLPKELVDADIE